MYAFKYMTLLEDQNYRHSKKKITGCQDLGKGRMTRWNMGFQDNETILYNTVTVDTLNHAFGKTKKTYNTNREL